MKFLGIDNPRNARSASLMNSPKLALRIAATIFGIMFFVQIWRLATGAEVRVAGHDVPTWASVVGACVAGLMCGWMGWLASRRATDSREKQGTD